MSWGSVPSSIARVANEIGMSKSGLFSHFASKQDLQLATIATAEAIYAAEVIEPAMQVPAGRRRDPAAELRRVLSATAPLT